MRMETRPDLLDRLREDPGAGAVFEVLAAFSGVHAVGGGVRDALRGETPQDLDFAVEGDAPKLAAAVAHRLGGEVEEHDRFGTARVRAGGHAYDFATTRAELYAHPGALPEVRGATLQEDLRRRDFTVNAIALAVGAPQPGRLTAHPQALGDLDDACLRVLHDESFADDPTRLFRLARYAARLGFEPEPHTVQLARAAIDSGVLDTVSGPRLGQELRLAAGETDPVAVLVGLDELGLLERMHTGLGFDPAFAARALAALPAEGRRELVVLAATLRDLPAADAARLLERLGAGRDETRVALALTSRLPEVAERLARVERPSEIDSLLEGHTPEEAALIAALGPEEPVRRWLSQLRHVRLEINGADLRAAGVPEGREIGAGLAAARAAALDRALLKREEQLAAALGIISR